MRDRPSQQKVHVSGFKAAGCLPSCQADQPGCKQTQDLPNEISAWWKGFFWKTPEAGLENDRITALRGDLGSSSSSTWTDAEASESLPSFSFDQDDTVSLLGIAWERVGQGLCCGWLNASVTEGWKVITATLMEVQGVLSPQLSSVPLVCGTGRGQHFLTSPPSSLQDFY